MDGITRTSMQNNFQWAKLFPYSKLKMEIASVDIQRLSGFQTSQVNLLKTIIRCSLIYRSNEFFHHKNQVVIFFLGLIRVQPSVA